jgi:hypothetical protein
VTRTEERVLRWPWQLTAVAGLLILTGGVYVLVSVGILIAFAIGHGPTAAHALLTLLLAPVAGAMLVTGLRLNSRPTWFWWWAGLGCLALLGVADTLDAVFAGRGFRPGTALLPTLAVVALLTPRVRQVVRLYSAASQPREAATRR